MTQGNDGNTLKEKAHPADVDSLETGGGNIIALVIITGDDWSLLDYPFLFTFLLGIKKGK